MPISSRQPQLRLSKNNSYIETELKLLLDFRPDINPTLFWKLDPNPTIFWKPDPNPIIF